MRDATIPQTVLFPDLFNQPLVATFDQPHASSDGGAILLKAAEARYGVIEDFARCLVDDRQPGKVRHTLADLLAQRRPARLATHDLALRKPGRGARPLCDGARPRRQRDRAPSATRGALGLLRRLLAVLRIAFPKARFLVRLDGGFATPEIFKCLDAEPGLDDVVARAEHAVLTRFAESTMVEARTQSEASGQTHHVDPAARDAAGTWVRERRVVIKAEVVRLEGRAPRDNARFVITNLRQTPRFVYEHVYCARG